MSVLSFKHSLTTTVQTLALDKDMIAGTATRFDRWLEGKGLSRQFRRAVYGAGALAAGFAIAANPVQALGVMAFGVLQMAPFMRNNSNKRANVFLGCALMAPHLAMLGADIAVMQVALAGTRAYTMNLINDESYKTRIAVSAAFLAAGFGISAAFVPATSLLTALPLAAMTCGTIADACPDRMTHISRIFRIAGATLLMPYHAAYSGSLAGLANETIGAVNLTRTAVQNDVPIHDGKGRALNAKEQLQGWWNSVVKMDRIPESLAGQKDPLETGMHRLRKALSHRPSGYQ